MMNCLNYLILSYKSVKIQYIVYKWEREKLHVQMDSSAAVRLDICAEHLQ